MVTVQLDKQGRLYLGDKVRSKYGETFVVVEAPDEVVLLPVPEDPVASLEEMGKALEGKSIAEIKKTIRRKAAEEVLG